MSISKVTKTHEKIEIMLTHCVAKFAKLPSRKKYLIALLS